MMDILPEFITEKIYFYQWLKNNKNLLSEIKGSIDYDEGDKSIFHPSKEARNYGIYYQDEYGGYLFFHNGNHWPQTHFNFRDLHQPNTIDYIEGLRHIFVRRKMNNVFAKVRNFAKYVRNKSEKFCLEGNELPKYYFFTSGYNNIHGYNNIYSIYSDDYDEPT